jgi:hypothetical protein
MILSPLGSLVYLIQQVQRALNEAIASGLSFSSAVLTDSISSWSDTILLFIRHHLSSFSNPSPNSPIAIHPHTLRKHTDTQHNTHTLVRQTDDLSTLLYVSMELFLAMTMFSLPRR